MVRQHSQSCAMSCGDVKDAETDPEPSQPHSFPAALVINPRFNGYVCTLSEENRNRMPVLLAATM